MARTNVDAAEKGNVPGGCHVKSLLLSLSSHYVDALLANDGTIRLHLKYVPLPQVMAPISSLDSLEGKLLR